MACDGQNLISWRRSLPLPTNPLRRGSMHTISSYHGNRPTNTHTHKQTGLITIHCAAASLARNVNMHSIIMCMATSDCQSMVKLKKMFIICTTTVCCCYMLPLQKLIHNYSFVKLNKKNHSNPVVNIGRAAGDFGRNWTGKTVRDKNEKLKR